MITLSKVGPAGLEIRRIEWNDVLWSARMIVGEEGENVTMEGGVAVMSCMLRRWCVADPSGRTWPEFTDLLRAYSQPINPAWESKGSHAQQSRRERVRNLAWPACPLNARRAALHVLTGEAALTAPAAIHFADGPTSARFVDSNQGARIVQSAAKNTMLSMANSRRFAEEKGEVRVVPTCAGRVLAMVSA